MASSSSPSKTLSAHIEQYRRAPLPRAAKGLSAQLPTSESARRFSSVVIPKYTPLKRKFQGGPEATPDSLPRLKRERVKDEDEDFKVSPTAGRKSSPSKKKRVIEKRGYSDPSKYMHLNGLFDHLAPGLEVVFCGINPGVKSATDSHHFAHPTNHFWKCLSGGGMTGGVHVPPTEDGTIVERFRLGLTNLVERPSTEASELSPAECQAAVPRLLFKFIRDRPRIVCFVGMGIYEHFSTAIKNGIPDLKRKKTAKAIGLQNIVLRYPSAPAAVDEKAVGTSGVDRTYLFVVPSTSARVTQYQFKDKLASFVTLQALREQVVRGETPKIEEPLEVEAVEWYARREAIDGEARAGMDSADYLKQTLHQRTIKEGLEPVKLEETNSPVKLEQATSPVLTEFLPAN